MRKFRVTQTAEGDFLVGEESVAFYGVAACFVEASKMIVAHVEPNEAFTVQYDPWHK